MLNAVFSLFMFGCFAIKGFLIVVQQVAACTWCFFMVLNKKLFNQKGKKIKQKSPLWIWYPWGQTHYHKKERNYIKLNLIKRKSSTQEGESGWSQNPWVLFFDFSSFLYMLFANISFPNSSDIIWYFMDKD